MIEFFGIILLSIIFVVNVLLICGLPIGELTMGGQHKVLPKNLRFLAIVSLFVQAFAIIILLQIGEFIPLWFSYGVTKGICIFYAVYLSLNSIMNAASKSKKEKYIMTPLAILTALCFWLAAFL